MVVFNVQGFGGIACGVITSPSSVVGEDGICKGNLLEFTMSFIFGIWLSLVWNAWLADTSNYPWRRAITTWMVPESQFLVSGFHFAWAGDGFNLEHFIWIDIGGGCIGETFHCG